MTWDLRVETVYLCLQAFCPLMVMRGLPFRPQLCLPVWLASGQRSPPWPWAPPSQSRDIEELLNEGRYLSPCVCVQSAAFLPEHSQQPNHLAGFHYREMSWASFGKSDSKQSCCTSGPCLWRFYIWKLRLGSLDGSPNVLLTTAACKNEQRQVGLKENDWEETAPPG